ncbi:MAG: hypothetical protein U0166_29540, partial [Acidobacteriota bacterium]
ATLLGRQATRGGPHAWHAPRSRALDAATLAGALLLAGVAAMASPRVCVVADALVFATLAPLALRALDRVKASTDAVCELGDAVRDASLAPRRVGDYLALFELVLPFALVLPGLAAFALRLVEPAAGRRLLVPCGMALAAGVFLFLYESWIRQEVLGPGDDLRRRARVRAVHRGEVALCTACLLVAHLLLDVDWALHPSLALGASLAGGVAGVIGCAMCVGSELGQRRYRVA